jgi:hypothetical protein
MLIVTIWFVTSCSFVCDYRRFGGACCLHYFTHKKKAVLSSETPVATYKSICYLAQMITIDNFNSIQISTASFLMISFNNLLPSCILSDNPDYIFIISPILYQFLYTVLNSSYIPNPLPYPKQYKVRFCLYE